MGVELDWPNWPGFSERVMAEMERYGWPGNVRELRNVVERAVYRWEDAERPVDSIQFDPFHSPWAPKRGEVPREGAPSESHEPATTEASEDSTAAPPAVETDDFRASVDAFERALLEDALNRNRFNQRATASAIGLTYDQLRHALKRHKLLDAGSR